MNVPERIKLLSTFHYIYGAFTCIGGLFALSLLFVAPLLDIASEGSETPVPEFLGAMMGTLGVVLFVLIETFGILNILSGRWIRNGVNRTGSYVVAAFDCLNIPLGIALGIFTFVTLGKPEMEQHYARNTSGRIA